MSAVLAKSALSECFGRRCLAELLGKVGLPVIGAATTWTFSTMEDCVFELEYTHRRTGARVVREVAEFGLARRLAKELAKASGRRAIIRRKKARVRRSNRWTVQVACGESGEVYQIWRGLTKFEALTRLRVWEERKHNAVLVAWPEWMPLRLEVTEVAA